MPQSVLFSGTSLVAAILWLAGYTAAGYAGLALTTLPGTWLALIWLPSGLGLTAVWMLGTRLGLPLVMLGSLLVNVSGIFAARPSDLPVPAATLLLLAVAAVDMVQTALAARLWGQCGPYGLMGGSATALRDTGPGGEKPLLIWSLPVYGRFVLAALAAPAATCWILVLLARSGGYVPLTGLPQLLWDTLQLTIADSLGIVLVTPALTGLIRAVLSRRADGGLGEDAGAALGFGLLALAPVGLALQVPQALTLLAPVIALALLRHRLPGVALAVGFSSLALMILAAHGVFPGDMDADVPVDSLNGIILCLALTVLLLAVACEQMHQERRLLADRVALRTHELSEALAMAERMGQTDLLTGLGNRRALQDCLLHEAAVAARRPAGDEPDLSVIVVNLDRFRSLNERYGAATGDRVLMAVSGALSHLCRGTDTLFRSSAGEFTLICRSTPEDGALVLARKLSAAVQALRLPVQDGRHDGDLPPFLAGLTGATDLTAEREETLPLSACFGVAALTPGEDWEHWQRRADEALQEARAEGPGRIRAG